MRSGGAKSGAFWLGSLQLAQQCEGFTGIFLQYCNTKTHHFMRYYTGHHASAVPGLFISSMCFKSKNGQYQGACPQHYDLRMGLV